MVSWPRVTAKVRSSNTNRCAKSGLGAIFCQLSITSSSPPWIRSCTGTTQSSRTMSCTDPSLSNAQLAPRPDDTTGNSLNAATQTIPTTKRQRHLNPDIERLILEWRLYSLATQDTEASELALICRYFHEIVSTWRWRYVRWPRYVDTIRPSSASVKTASEGWTVVCKIVPMSVAPFVR